MLLFCHVHFDLPKNINICRIKAKGTPAWAADCAQLWTRAVAAEKRADAQEERLAELSNPYALPRKNWVELARRIARDLATYVVQVDIHCPIASDGKMNPHVDFPSTVREIVDGEFSPQKVRHWNGCFHGKAKAIWRFRGAFAGKRA